MGFQNNQLIPEFLQQVFSGHRQHEQFKWEKKWMSLGLEERCQIKPVMKSRPHESEMQMWLHGLILGSSRNISGGQVESVQKRREKKAGQNQGM